MALLRSDLQLQRDPAARFLPWVIAVMVFLGCLSLAGALALDATIAGWHRGIGDRLTAEIADQAGQPMAPRVEAALRVLRATPGIASATPLDRKAVEALLAPWLGAENLTADLPLPALIDLVLTPGAGVDARALSARLGAAVPGAGIDDPQPWLARLVRLAHLLQSLGFGIVGLIGLATIAMVVFATRAGLATHRDVIEVLHLIGARDGYIARQFQIHVLTLALQGGIAGLIVAGAVLYILGQSAGSLEAALLPPLRLDETAYAWLAVLPFAAALLATLTARITVLGNLRRMM